MRASFGLPALLVALVIGAGVFMMQSKSSGPTSATAQQAETQATQAVAGVNFGAADELAKAWYAQNSTYVGFWLDASYGITVERADATSYCLQGGAGTGVQHVLGPNGTAQPGPC